MKEIQENIKFNSLLLDGRFIYLGGIKNYINQTNLTQIQAKKKLNESKIEQNDQIGKYISLL